MANKKRKCGFCGERKEALSMVIIGLQAFCSKDHYIENQVKNKSKLIAKGKEIRFKALKQKVKTNDISHQKELTQNAFNKMRVLEELKWFEEQGLEPTCISCNKPNMDWCCGHFKSRGSQGNLRYDRNNTFLQCNNYCNKNLSGNINGNKTTRGYLQGLVDRFGEEKAKEMIDYCKSHNEVKKWTGEDLKEMRSEFSKISRSLV